MAADKEQRIIEIILNGQKVDATIGEMRKSVRALDLQMQKLPANSEEFVKKSKEWQQAKKRLDEVTTSSKGANSSFLAAKFGLEGITSASGLMKLGFQAAVAAFLPLLAFQSIVELGRKFLGLVDNVDKVRGSWQQLGVEQGAVLDDLYVRTEGIANTFNKEAGDVIKSANVLSKEFGITNAEALNLIEKGILAGADASGEMLDQVKEYSGQFATAKLSAEDFIAELVKGEKKGIFSDKAADTVKEFGLRIREQTVATRDALDAAFGQDFTDKIFKGLNDGSITTAEALRMVSAEMNNTTIPASKLQTVVADVFGGPGEDAGIEYLKTLKDVGGELDTMIDATNVLTRSQIDQLEANKDLAAAEAALGESFSGTGAALTWLSTVAKAFALNILVAVISSVKQTRNEILGTWQALKSFGSSIADMFIALKNGDFAGVKEAFSNIGGNASKAYWDGYLKNDREGLQEKKSQEEQAAAEAAKVQKQQDEKSRKEKEAADKKAAQETERRQKEHLKALERARNEYNKVSEQADLALQKLKIELMQEGIDKVLAKLRLQHDLELKEIAEQRGKVLSNIDAAETEKQAFLENLDAQKALKEEEFKLQQEEARKADAEKQKELDAKKLEDKLAAMDEEEALRQEKIEQQFGFALDAEDAKEAALLELKRSYLREKLAVLEEAGKGESLVAEKLKTEILKTDKEIADGKISNVKRTAEMKRALEQQMFQVGSDFLQLGVDLLSKDEEARRKNANLIKAFSAGKIISDLFAEISGYMAHPASTGTLGAVGTAKVILASARAGLALEQVRSQKFAEGGYTGAGMFVSGGGKIVDSTGFAVSGVAHEGEWYSPKWMTESPKYARTIAWLESERKAGKGFAEGGYTSSAPVPAASPADNSLLVVETLQTLSSKFDQVAKEIREMPLRIEVNYDPFSATNADQKAMALRRKSTLG